jgi:predicted Rossmann-fold nucleotide-binding protein
MDEMFELLTLMQTQKIESKVILVLYGTDYWRKILNFPALLEYGMISPEDLDLMQEADTPQGAFDLLKDGLTKYYLEPEAPLAQPEQDTPHIAKSRI